MLTRDDLKKRYAGVTKEVEVKSWGGSVEIRKLTVMESNEVQGMLMNNATPGEVKDNKIEITVALFNESNMMAVSLALVNPKMSIKEMKELTSDALEGITEIKLALDSWSTPKK